MSLFGGVNMRVLSVEFILRSSLKGVAIAATLFVQQACASSVIVARVVNFGSYGNGNVAIELDTVIDQPNCSIKYIELPSNSPVASSTLTVAALAFASDKRIKVVTDTCYNGVPSLSAARSSYILVVSP